MSITAPPPAPEVEPSTPGDAPRDGSSVPYAGWRLAGLLGALALLGWANIWMLIVILAIVVMITLHELGHYVMAKRGGMKVTEFFLGFGPKIWATRRGETEYGIKLIPAGAYVKIPGMVNLDEVAPEDEPRTYREQSFWARIGVAVAGSAMHFLLALVLIFIALVIVGQPGRSLTATDLPNSNEIDRVYRGSGADAAGIEPGDVIVSVGGEPVTDGDELREAIAPHRGDTTTVVVERGGTEISRTVDIKAFTAQGVKACGLGVQMAPPPAERMGPAEGLVKAPQEFGNVLWFSMKGLGSFFSPSGISDFAGQVGSAQQDARTVDEPPEQPAGDPCADTSTAAPASSGSTEGENRILSIYGLVRIGSDVGGVNPAALIGLFALINIFIGVFNLIPLLPFDGGHVAIACYERIQEKRQHLSGRYFADVTRLLPLTYGVVVVLGLMFFSSLYLDIVNPIGG